MNYIVFDLEFNQHLDFGENQNSHNSECPFEIIQVGAIKLDEKLQVVSTFDRLVKPELYTSIHPFVKQITGITSEKLASAKKFNEIYKEFAQFINKGSILCVWGVTDMKELLRNVKYHKLDISLIPKEYINVQMYASKYFHCPKGSNIGLRNAVEILNIDAVAKFHDAFNDAFYTTEVFKHVYSNSIKPDLYQPDKERKQKRLTKKSKLDTYKLIKQFEKMYSRQMTEEEQSIIKLAYMMGRTNQFQSV